MITKGQQVIQDWYQKKNWEQFPFQKEMEATYLAGFSGLLNAPTGSGKTFALFLPFLADFINKHPDTYNTKADNGLLMLWITPPTAVAERTAPLPPPPEMVGVKELEYPVPPLVTRILVI